MRTENLKLVRPNLDYKDTYLDGLKEFQDEKLPWMMHLNIENLRQNFESFVQAELGKTTAWTKDTPVKQSEYWALIDGVFVGQIAIRHRLNDDLRVMGGHIGYETRPSFRGQGIASEMLRQVLPLARNLGITQALLTCNDDNKHSIRVIEKNGGVLKETKPQFEGGPLKRYYWFSL